jgi:hypothetical protein
MSSYLILYPLLVVRVVLADGIIKCTKITADLPLLMTLIVLFISSILWVSGLLRWKNNVRISGRATENTTIEMAIYIVTYIVPLIFIEMNFTGLVVSMVLFVVVGFIFIRSDKDYLNPTFLFFGYKTYRIDGKVILSRTSLDALNISLIESPHGISAREIVQNTYIILPR